MMRTYQFDDAVLPPGRFRFHVLRPLAVRKHLPELLKRQKGKCALCSKRLDEQAQVDHIKSVKSFAYDLSMPLTEAYVRCHSIKNIRAICAKCNNARNRKRNRA